MHGNGTHGMDGWDWAWMTPMMLLWVALIALAVYLGIRLAGGSPAAVPAERDTTRHDTTEEAS